MVKKNPFKINFKSSEKVRGKPKKEIHQYVGVGNEGIISRIEIDRKEDGKSKTKYKIFRWKNGIPMELDR
jgi:hypothetical protein